MSGSNSGDAGESHEVTALVKRLRPGDVIRYRTSTGREYVHDVIGTEIKDGYYRVRAQGPKGGRYILMPEKPEEMGNHPAPEVFWENPDPDEGNNPYELVTRGEIILLRIIAEPE